MKLSCFMEPRSLQSDLGLRTWENIKVDNLRKLKFSYFDDKTFNNNLISHGFSESEVLQNNRVKSLKRKINRKNQENSFWRHNLDIQKSERKLVMWWRRGEGEVSTVWRILLPATSGVNFCWVTEVSSKQTCGIKVAKNIWNKYLDR